MEPGSIEQEERADAAATTPRSAERESDVDPRSMPRSPQVEPHSRPRWWAGIGPAAALAAALQLGVNAYVSGVRPELGEALALRWLRVVDAHPWRSPIAVALVVHGVRLLFRRRGE